MIVDMHIAYSQSSVGEEVTMTKTKNQLVEDEKHVVLKEFRQIPGVGKSIAEDLWDLGLRSVADLKNQDPEALYTQLCAYQGTHVDRCMLYVFRCAVYYASNDVYDAELLKWWNWMR
jgi:Pathogenicity locus